jgi:hypothetical protein
MELTERVKETFVHGRQFLVRPDLRAGAYINGIHVVSPMVKLAGQYVTVYRIITGGSTCAIRIREDNGCWRWSDEMFVDPYGEEVLPDVDIHIDHLMEVLCV